MVDRYEVEDHAFSPSDTEEFVLHDDYAALEAENARLKAESHKSHERGVRRVRDYLRSINRHAAATEVEREFDLASEAAAEEAEQ